LRSVPIVREDNDGFRTQALVLFAYYTYTQQTLKVVEAMAEVLRSRGCEVHLAAIDFIDARYAKRFAVFPMPHPFLDVLGMIPAELRRRLGKIRVPDVTEREYDLVCIGSPPGSCRPMFRSARSCSWRPRAGS
jgi:hypothetical protein